MSVRRMGYLSLRAELLNFPALLKGLEENYEDLVTHVAVL